MQQHTQGIAAICTTVQTRLPFPTFCGDCEVSCATIGHFNRFCYSLNYVHMTGQQKQSNSNNSGITQSYINIKFDCQLRLSFSHSRKCSNDLRWWVGWTKSKLDEARI